MAEKSDIRKPLLEKNIRVFLNTADPPYSPTLHPSNSFKYAIKSSIKGEHNVDTRFRDHAGTGRSALFSEIEKQILLAGPMVVVNLLQYSLQLVSLMFVGHLGKLHLASTSIGSSFASVSGFILLIGMGSALETLCGQAFGAKQLHLLGVYLQRAALVLNVASIPISFVWFNMEKILTVLGQDPEISSKAGDYARWLIPGLFAYAFLQPIVKFLQTQSLVVPMVVTSAFTTVIHILMSWMLILKLNMGIKGAALAISISYWINVVLLIIYIKASTICKQTWNGFTMEAFHELGSFFKLAVPSAGMICLEYWSFEMLVLLSGILPNPQLEMSTLSICLSLTSITYMLPFGLSAAASTRVSNELGAGHAVEARRAVFVTLSLGISVAVTVSITLFSLRNLLGWAFSSDEEVVVYVSKIIPFLSLGVLIDGVQGVLSGVVRGCGWQLVGAIVNLAAYYIVGIPMAIFLAFYLHLGGQGLYFGILSGLSTQMVCLVTVTLTTNWEEQAKEAVSRWFTPESSTPIESTFDV